MAMHLALNYFIILFMILLVFGFSTEAAGYLPEERYALLQLRDSINSSFNLHANWTGPPCFKNQSKYAGIACLNWHIVHITLDGIQLAGSLPPTFLQNITFLTKLSLKNNSILGPLPNLTSLIHLESLLLSQNKFTGSIPTEYIHLPKLIQLELQENHLDGSIPPFNQPDMATFNVSYNNLQGPIPKTSVLQRFPGSCYDHNLKLCGSPLGKNCPAPPIGAPPPLPNKKLDTHLQAWSIGLIAASAAMIPFIVMLVFLCHYRKTQAKEMNRGGQAEEPWGDLEEKRNSRSESTDDPDRTVELEFFDKNLPAFDLDDILRASAEVLGKGILGTTYKVMLESGAVVAVKRLKGMNGLNKKEYIQQMQLLGNIRHENLVEIVSFYYSKEEKLAIYEFLPNGNLFELLHENRGVGRVPLSWTTRLSIIRDIAKGLTFLHQSLHSHKVPHANLKSSNVLIIPHNTQTYQSKLTDFGFLPLLPSRKSSQKLAVGKAPEFSLGKKLTPKADVYCFGIIILEVITGRIPGEISRGNDDKTDDLCDWVRTVVNNDWSTDILDVEILAAKEGHDEMLKLTEIALQCTDARPENRPKMSEVLKKIEEIEEANQDND